MAASAPASALHFQAPLVHAHQFRTSEEVLAFFGRGGDRFGYRGISELGEIGLSVRERADIIAFIKSFEGPTPSCSRTPI